MTSHQPISPLDTAPQTDLPDLGIARMGRVAEALEAALADTYLLIVKTHACHWNVVGPLFYSVHNLTEEHYEDMFEAADVLAERMRALGALAPMSIAAMLSQTEIAEASGTPSAREMIADLAASHEALARRMNRVIAVAAEAGDAATEDLATARTAFHQKAAWMLRALIAE